QNLRLSDVRCFTTYPTRRPDHRRGDAALDADAAAPAADELLTDLRERLLQHGACRLVVGPQAQRLAVVRDRRSHVAVLRQRVAEIAVRLERARVESQRRLVLAYRTVDVTARAQNDTEIHPRGNVVRAQDQRLRQLGTGAVEIVRRVQQRAEVGVRLDVARPERYRPPVFFRRLGRAPELLQQEAAVEAGVAVER